MIVPEMNIGQLSKLIRVRVPDRYDVDQQDAGAAVQADELEEEDPGGM